MPGDSTDDELDPENAAVFEEKFRKLEEERLQIYADVVEEYTDSHLLMNRFNKWRVSFPRWYKVCFIEECTGSVQGCKTTSNLHLTAGLGNLSTKNRLRDRLSGSKSRQATGQGFSGPYFRQESRTVFLTETGF